MGENMVKANKISINPENLKIKTKLGAAESSSLYAAIMIFVVALILVLYIMAIPPEDRSKLLGTSGSSNSIKGPNYSSSGSSIGNNDFYFKGPGFVDEINSAGEKHNLPSVYLKTQINSNIFVEDSAFYIKESIGSSIEKIIPFGINNLESVSNVYMTFLAKKREGILTITLNDYILYQGELDSVNYPPKKISEYLLKKDNVIKFKVSDPGLLFWKSNEYIINDFKIFGDVTSTSSQKSYVNFELGASEFNFLKKARLKYKPSCAQKTVGELFIYVNDNLIFNQIPDCEILNIYDIPKSLLIQGVNSLKFATEKDSYLIDLISLETTMKENDDLLYYFDLSDKLFNSFNEAKAICGEIDGMCPSGCNADDDKDCCFIEYSGNGYWCDAPTFNNADRCVGRVDNYNVGFCLSGYEDDSGRPKKEFKNLCGDDTDGLCPSGCSEFHDKDCCLKEGSQNYWCDDITPIGLSGVCLNSVTNDQCSWCPSGYQGEDKDPDCEYKTKNSDEVNYELKSNYDVKLTLKFVDDSKRKRGVIKINGFETSFSTLDNKFDTYIDRFLESGTNYVQILPESDFYLVSTEIKVESN